MHLGAFSVSLAVKDLTASKTFYEAIGFETLGGDAAAGWLMLKSGDTVLGLFQGMFEKNTLTFNPGWDQSAQPLDDFMDVRAIQADLKSKGLTLDVATDPEGTGPAHIVLTDPDGNPVLIDQHR
ncbi:VOC family protein [Marivita sp.]|jgi:catechol 2,3-dioxygenase-like lactoylglutathione lyase family enzyme|uniref:VOC family protein n=1 Tax=Marivita sp. TaxID=2003365 RepID=UPI003A8B9277